MPAMSCVQRRPRLGLREACDNGLRSACFGTPSKAIQHEQDDSDLRVHRASERNLKGKDRKEWTEWCEDRGSRHNYEYRRYSSDRNCYQKADNKGLTGDKRRKFINDCLDIPNRY